MWIKIAELYVQWKIILDQHDLANQFQLWTNNLSEKLKGCEKEYCAAVTNVSLHFLSLFPLLFLTPTIQAGELKQFREEMDPQQISVVKEEKVSCSFQDLLAIGYRYR